MDPSVLKHHSMLDYNPVLIRNDGSSGTARVASILIITLPLETALNHKRLKRSSEINSDTPPHC